MARQKGVGKRVTFVVNENNPKEMDFYDFIGQQYNTSSTIKEIFYKLLNGQKVDIADYYTPTDNDDRAEDTTDETPTQVQELAREEIIEDPVAIQKQDKQIEAKIKQEEKKKDEIEDNIKGEWDNF